MKLTGKKSCSNGIAERKGNTAPNTAEVANMVEAAMTYQRNIFSKINISTRCNTKITHRVRYYDDLIKDRQ